MNLDINPAAPQIMHIDLNSCFAMVEQQANPFLRGKPVGMTNRLSPGATIIAASYEAKRYGVGVGTKASDARWMAPGIVILETDPAKYVYVYQIFSKILKSYSPKAQMKSIDEGIIDFAGTRLVNNRPLSEIGHEIKARLRHELGEYMSCNVGIATNRFLAKMAASLHKPDGLDIITQKNLLTTYQNLDLIDLTGINRRYQARLFAAGIFSPLQFYEADEVYLTKQVFHSILGHLWFLRLRGHEVDDVEFGIKSIGRQYVLHEWTGETAKLKPILMKLCEGMGRKLRGKGLCARGIYIGCYFTSGQSWHARKKLTTRLFTTAELFERALGLLEQRPFEAVVHSLFVTCYGLEPADSRQMALFETADVKRWKLMDAADAVNNKYGEFTVMPATMANTEHLAPTKIPFGTTKYYEYIE